MLLGSIEEAASAYADAVSSGDAEPSQIASTRKQALQIAAVYEDEAIFEEISFAFPKLGIVACSGHVIDSPGGARRFPPEAEPEVKRKIEEALESMGASCGYSSAACGTDILFLETMAERGGETHVFLPFAKEEFIETSVRRAGGNWVARFEKVLDQATAVHSSRGKATMAKILCIPFVTASCSDSPPCGAEDWMKIRNYSFSGMGKGGDRRNRGTCGKMDL